MTVWGEGTTWSSVPPRASCQAVNKAAAQPFLTTPPGESDLLCRLVKMFFLSLSLSAFLPLHHAPPPLVCYYHQPGTFDSYRGTRLSLRALGRSVSVKCSVLYPDVRCQKCVDVAVSTFWLLLCKSVSLTCSRLVLLLSVTWYSSWVSTRQDTHGCSLGHYSTAETNHLATHPSPCCETTDFNKSSWLSSLSSVFLSFCLVGFLSFSYHLLSDLTRKHPDRKPRRQVSTYLQLSQDLVIYG